DLRHLFPRRRPLAQRQGQAQAPDDPRLHLPDGRGPGALARRPGPWSTRLLRPHAGVPHRRAVYDRCSRGRVHPVYWWGLALIVLGVAARVALLGSPTWAHATQSLFG